MDHALDEKIMRAYVGQLPRWDPNEENDPNWCRPVDRYGFQQIPRDEFQIEAIRRIGWSLKNEMVSVANIDPKAIVYTNQPFVRVDAVVYYLDNEEPFDKDSWYGTDLPVVFPWNQKFVVFDGTHRVLAARMKGHPIKAIMPLAENTWPLMRR